MKKELKHFIMGASTMAVLMGGLTFAANRSETIQRTFRDIKIKLNGSEVIPKDANGNIVEPFLINGTTYLPVRAVGEAMGLNVDWDGETSTILLVGNVDNKKSNKDILKSVFESFDKEEAVKKEEAVLTEEEARFYSASPTIYYFSREQVENKAKILFGNETSVQHESIEYANDDRTSGVTVNYDNTTGMYSFHEHPGI